MDRDDMRDREVKVAELLNKRLLTPVNRSEAPIDSKILGGQFPQYIALVGNPMSYEVIGASTKSEVDRLVKANNGMGVVAPWTSIVSGKLYVVRNSKGLSTQEGTVFPNRSVLVAATAGVTSEETRWERAESGSGIATSYYFVSAKEGGPSGTLTLWQVVESLTVAARQSTNELTGTAIGSEAVMPQEYLEYVSSEPLRDGTPTYVIVRLLSEYLCASPWIKSEVASTLEAEVKTTDAKVTEVAFEEVSCVDELMGTIQKLMSFGKRAVAFRAVHSAVCKVPCFSIQTRYSASEWGARILTAVRSNPQLLEAYGEDNGSVQDVAGLLAGTLARLDTASEQSIFRLVSSLRNSLRSRIKESEKFREWWEYRNKRAVLDRPVDSPKDPEVWRRYFSELSTGSVPLTAIGPAGAYSPGNLFLVLSMLQTAGVRVRVKHSTEALERVLARTAFANPTVFDAVTRRAARTALKQSALANEELTVDQVLEEKSPTVKLGAEKFWSSCGELLALEYAWSFGQIDWPVSDEGKDVAKSIGEIAGATFVRMLMFCPLDVREVFNSWTHVVYGQDDELQATGIVTPSKFFSDLLQRGWAGIRDASIDKKTPLDKLEWEAFRKMIAAVPPGVVFENPKLTPGGFRRIQEMLKSNARFCAGASSPRGISLGYTGVSQAPPATLRGPSITTRGPNTTKGLEPTSATKVRNPAGIEDLLDAEVQGIDWAAIAAQSTTKTSKLSTGDSTEDRETQYFIELAPRTTTPSSSGRTTVKATVEKVSNTADPDQLAFMRSVAGKCQGVVSTVSVVTARAAEACALWTKKVEGGSGSETVAGALADFLRSTGEEVSVEGKRLADKFCEGVEKKVAQKVRALGAGALSSEEISELVAQEREEQLTLVFTEAATLESIIPDLLKVQIAPLEVTGYDKVGRVQITIAALDSAGAVDIRKTREALKRVHKVFFDYVPSSGGGAPVVADGLRLKELQRDDSSWTVFCDDFSIDDFNRLTTELQADGGTELEIEVVPGVQVLKTVQQYLDTKGVKFFNPKSALENAEFLAAARPMLLQWIDWSALPGNVSSIRKSQVGEDARQKDLPKPAIFRTFSDSIYRLAWVEKGIASAGSVGKIMFRTPTGLTNENYQFFWYPSPDGKGLVTETALSVVMRLTQRLVAKAALDTNRLVVHYGKPGVVREEGALKVAVFGPEVRVKVAQKAFSSVQSIRLPNGVSKAVSLGEILGEFGRSPNPFEQAALSIPRLARVEAYRIEDISVDKAASIEDFKSRLFSLARRSELQDEVSTFGDPQSKQEAAYQESVRAQLASLEKDLKILGSSYDQTEHQLFGGFVNASDTKFRELSTFVIPCFKFRSSKGTSQGMEFVIPIDIYAYFVVSLVDYLQKVGINEKLVADLQESLKAGLVLHLKEIDQRARVYAEGSALPIIKPASVELLPHQSKGVRFLMSRKHAILADDRGLGKTIQSIIAAESVVFPEREPILVITPARLTENFATEVLKFASNPDVVVIKSGASNDLETRVEAGKDASGVQQFRVAHIPVRSTTDHVGAHRWNIISMDLLRRARLLVTVSADTKSPDEVLDITVELQKARGARRGVSTNILGSKEFKNVWFAEESLNITEMGRQGAAELLRTALVFFLYKTLYRRVSYPVYEVLTEVAAEALREMFVQPFLLRQGLVAALRGWPVSMDQARNISPSDLYTLLDGLKKAVGIRLGWNPDVVQRVVESGDLAPFVEVQDEVPDLQSAIFERPWACVVLDEAHYVKNPASRRYRAIEKVMEGAGRMWLLSGTPIAQRIEDLWSLLRLISHPLGAGNAKYEFVCRFGNGPRTKESVLTVKAQDASLSRGITNQEGLKKTTADVMMWRYKDDVADIPPQATYERRIHLRRLVEKPPANEYPRVLLGPLGGKERVDRYQEYILRTLVDKHNLSDLELAIYYEVLDTARELWLERGSTPASNVFDVVAQAVKFDPGVLDLKSFSHLSTDKLGAMQIAGGIVGRLKAPYALVEALAHVKKGDKVIIFCSWTPVIDWLTTRLRNLSDVTERVKTGKVSRFEQALVEQFGAKFISRFSDEDSVVRVDGKCTQPEIRNAVNRFRSDAGCKVLVGHILSAGTGLNLQAATVSIFVDIPWRASAAEQAEDRTRRIGQSKNTSVVWMVSDAAIDQYMWRALKARRAAIEAVQEGRDAPSLYEGDTLTPSDVSTRAGELLDAEVKAITSLIDGGDDGDDDDDDDGRGPGSDD